MIKLKFNKKILFYLFLYQDYISEILYPTFGTPAEFLDHLLTQFIQNVMLCIPLVNLYQFEINLFRGVMLQRFFESFYQTGFGSEIVFQVQVGGP
jgi:hypothetical protein